MDWLRNFIQSLPLNYISDLLDKIVLWWSDFVKDVPSADLPLFAYSGGSVIVLILWIFVARILPRPLGGISWIVLFAVLCTPGTSLGDSGEIAPASMAVVYAILMKDFHSAAINILPILLVALAGLFVGFIWQVIRYLLEKNSSEKKAKTAHKNKKLA